MCARMHRADWQYQCAHHPSPIALPPHCPPPIPWAHGGWTGGTLEGLRAPYRIAPRQSPGQSGSTATATLSHGDNTPKPNHQMTPHSRGWRPSTILVIGNVPLRGVPGTHRCSGISSRSSLYFESIQGYPYH